MEKRITLAGGTPGVPRKRQYKTYFIQSADGAIKIGKTVDVPRRLKTFSTATAEPLTLLAVIDGDEEKALHRRFVHLRLRRNREWFHPSPSLLEFIARIQAENRKE